MTQLTQTRILITITFCLFYGLGVWYNNFHFRNKDKRQTIDFDSEYWKEVMAQNNWVVYPKTQQYTCCISNWSCLSYNERPLMDYKFPIFDSMYTFNLPLSIVKTDTSKLLLPHKDKPIILALTPIPPSVITFQSTNHLQLPKIEFTKPVQFVNTLHTHPNKLPTIAKNNTTAK